jgi:hypothetical protein
MPPSEEIRKKVKTALVAGEAPMDVARKFRLSILTVAEIAGEGSEQPLPKKPVPPMRTSR